VLGKTLLAELKRPAIRDWLSGVAASNKRLANIQSVLRSALQDAVNDGVIEANPLYGWKYERKDVVKREDDVDPFSSEEQTAILDALSGQKRNLIQFALWTGLRTSELCALEWGDIDWRRGTLRVQRAKTQVSDEAETTKTRSGVREVKLLGPALDALQAQKPHTFMKGGVVFENPRTGETWTGDQPIRHGVWVPAMRKAGVRYRRPYQTRHTYASMMLSAGESPMWVAQQMGHSDWTMIARIYGRWIPEAAPDAGQKAVKIFAQNAGITAANAGKLMPASELSTDNKSST
jgi:integrase